MTNNNAPEDKGVGRFHMSDRFFSFIHKDDISHLKAHQPGNHNTQQTSVHTPIDYVTVTLMTDDNTQKATWSLPHITPETKPLSPLRNLCVRIILGWSGFSITNPLTKKYFQGWITGIKEISFLYIASFGGRCVTNRA